VGSRSLSAAHDLKLVAFPVYTSVGPGNVSRIFSSTVAPTNAFPWRKPDAVHRRYLETSPRHCPGPRDAAGAARPLPYGGKALGRLTLTADGRMMSVVCDGRTELPAGVRREYSSYCGNHTYDGERLVTRVDAASDPTRIGSDQVRGVRFEGERMVLIPPPRLTGESEEHREITR
jgi:hypothetical protein